MQYYQLAEYLTPEMKRLAVSATYHPTDASDEECLNPDAPSPRSDDECCPMGAIWMALDPTNIDFDRVPGPLAFTDWLYFQPHIDRDSEDTHNSLLWEIILEAAEVFMDDWDNGDIKINDLALALDAKDL